MAKKKHRSRHQSSSSEKSPQQQHATIPSSPPPPPISDHNPNTASPVRTIPTAVPIAAVADLSNPFQRIFTANDEILILKALFDFKSQTGKDPNTHFSTFYESFFEDHSLSLKPTRKQLREKIRKLKLKFDKKVQKGKTLDFSDPHEEQLFQLYQNLWGKENVAQEKKESAFKKASTSKEEPFVVEKENGDNGMGFAWFEKMCMDVGVFKRVMDFIEVPKKEEIEQRWKKLRLEEIKLFEKRAELVQEHAKLILEGLQRES